MEGYAEIWEKFVAERRLEFGGHTDPSWTNGHTLSASLMIPVNATALWERLEPPRDALRSFPFVSPHPDHFMHVTLFLLGFVVPEPRGDDEVAPERLAKIELGVRRALANFPPFKVELSNLNAFPAAAFVEIHDGGMLERLRDALRGECGLREPPGPPHLTLAYFQPEEEIPAPPDLVSALERFRDWPVGEMLVGEVDLTLLDLRQTYPEPEPLARIPLAGSPPADSPPVNAPLR